MSDDAKTKSRAELVAAERERILADRSIQLQGTEADIVQAFKWSHQAGYYETQIPCGPEDTIVTEMPLKYGRADIVVFHVDGTASIIEAKHGGNGYTHVVAGIGQVGLYAMQLAMNNKSGLRKIRRCLMWSSTGDNMLDTLITMVCDAAGVIWIPMASMRQLKANRLAAEIVVERAYESQNH